ncbi:MAG: ABC transporter ATP-binding protein, partial [Verrucomicrobiota bacterium]
MSLIEVQNARKTYQLGDTEIHALKGVDLKIDEGEFVAVWGPSGSGKSTLCHLMGVIDQPTSGTVLFDGVDVNSLSDNEQSELRNHKLGFVFQTFNLVPVMSALENVMLPLQMQGSAAAEAQDRAREELGRVGLDKFVNHWPQKLSGGQRQRVAIARALVTKPKVVVADEPTANLDSENAMLIINLMRELDHSSGTSFIFST